MLHCKYLSLAILILVWLPATALASDYQIPGIEIEVEISEDGTLSVNEHRTYVFDGDFSWADYRLPRTGFDEITNIRVSENGHSYVHDNSESPETFSVSETSRNVIVKWHYEARDTIRTFTVSYELSGALVHGEEWTEFFWNYLASGREKSTDSLSVRLLLPEEISSDSLYAWSRVPDDRITIETEDGAFRFQGEDLTRNESVRVRALFPNRIFHPDVVHDIQPELTLENVEREELNIVRERFEQAQREAFYASITIEVTIIIIGISFVGFLVLFRNFGKRHSTGTLSDQETVMIPDQTPPAIIGRLLNHGQTSGHHLVATLFDLARRGWFVIQEKEKKKKWYASESSEFQISVPDQIPADELTDWEQQLVETVRSKMKSGNLSFKELLKGHDSGMKNWYSEWSAMVKSAYQERNWIDRESYKGVALNLIIQVPLMGASIFMMIAGTMFALAGLIFSTLMAAFSFAIIRRTKDGEEIFHRWNAYRKGLKNANRYTLNMRLMDRHFIYATAFQLSEKEIQTVMESGESSSSEFVIPWLILIAGSSSSPARVASSVTTMTASGQSSFSGSVGGSGASMGSAGGGASGGAG
jgi:uncharacterized membrane protein